MKNIVLSLTTTLCCLLFSSCLGIQSSYDYEPANIDNNVYMNLGIYPIASGCVLFPEKSHRTLRHRY